MSTGLFDVKRSPGEIRLHLQPENSQPTCSSHPSPSAGPTLIRHSLSNARSRFADFVSPPSLGSSVNDVNSNYGDEEDDDDEDEDNEQGQAETSNAEETESKSNEGLVEEDPLFKLFSSPKKQQWFAKFTMVMESALLVVISSVMFCTLVYHPLQDQVLLGLRLWRWSLLALLLLCGRLISDCFVMVVVLMLNCTFNVSEELVSILYYIRIGICRCIWAAIVVVFWHFCFVMSIDFRHRKHHLLSQVPLAILSAVTIWQVKKVAFRLLMSSFYMKLFFERVMGLFYYRYVLRVLAGTPLNEREKELEAVVGSIELSECIEELEAAADSGGFKPNKVTAKMLLMLIDDFTEFKLALTGDFDRRRASNLFQHVVGSDTNRYIGEEHLIKFFGEEEGEMLAQSMGLNGGKLKKSEFQDWLI